MTTSRRFLFLTVVTAICVATSPAQISRAARPALKPALSIMPGLLVVQDINYCAGQFGATLMDVYFPAEITRSTPNPAIVLIHGGGWMSGSRNEPIFVGMALEWAQRGYV